MDLSGPFIKGLPVTDRREKEELWPRYMIVGAFVPFSPKEVQDRYDQERRDRIAAGLEGPVQMETTVSQKGQTLYFVGPDECSFGVFWLKAEDSFSWALGRR